MSKRHLLAALLLSGGLAAGIAVTAPGLAEEPPAGEPAAEEAEAKNLSGDVVAAAIKDYVERDTRLKGDYFLIYDRVVRKPQVLTLKGVDATVARKTSEGEHFACAEFRAEDGTTRCLDFFLEGGAEGALTVGKISIHKVDGKERYSWKEEDGGWTSVPAK